MKRGGEVKSATLHIESRTERLIEVREFVASKAAEFGFSDEEASKIALAVDEACTNVIKHAYKFDPTQQIAVTIRPKDGAFEISIVDSGNHFNPDEIQSPNMREYFSHFRRGGLGMYLMKSLMDKVEYMIGPGKKNEVRLVKYLTR